MTTRLLAELEKHIDRWVEQNCEESDWPDAFFYEGEIRDMALAAWLIFKASMDGQRHAREQKR